MKNGRFFLYSLVICFLLFASCKNPAGGADSITGTYTGTKDGVTYTLLLSPGRIRAAHAVGENYKLTVTRNDGTEEKISAGKLSGVVDNMVSNSLTLQPDYSNTPTYLAVVSDTRLLSLTGLITFSDGTTMQGPGSFIVSNGNGGGGVGGNGGAQSYAITMQNDGNGTATASPNPAAAGATVNLTATPSGGFGFKEWEIVSGSVTLLPNTTTSPATFTMPSAAVTIRAVFEVLPADTPNLSLSSVSFSDITFGAAQPAAQTITITNSGDVAATVSGITLSGAGATSFALLGTLTPTIAAGGTASFTVRPGAGLAVGTHSATITATYSGGSVTSATAVTNVSIVVNAVTYTVTFNSNGGTPVGTITGVVPGTPISAPTDPTHPSPTGANTGRFRGWYTDNGTFAIPYTFGTPVTANITLYADWGYRPGDTGPGGGLIFYREELGFDLFTGSTPADTSSVRAYYLEVALNDISGYPAWALPWPDNNILIPGLSQDPTDQSDWAIGRGRKNTTLIINHGSANGYTTPAASYCRALGSDWFLPSRNELNTLYQYWDTNSRSANFNLTTNWYWSSSQGNSRYAWFQYFVNGGQDYDYKDGTRNVRAIRAF